MGLISNQAVCFQIVIQCPAKGCKGGGCGCPAKISARRSGGLIRPSRAARPNNISAALPQHSVKQIDITAIVDV